MAGHELIDGYLRDLARHLPADTVDELSDGLAEAYHRNVSRGLPPDDAARATVAEFGPPGLVVAAFVAQSPGRRAARAWLLTGPVVGTCWAATLSAAHAQAWPVPVPVRIAFGATLLAAVTALVVAATGRHNLRRTRAGAFGGLGLIALDAAVLTTVLVLRPGFVWPLAVAVPASLVRIALSVRALPRLLAR